jgi:dual specificity MAP kinase phosphatase
MDAFESAHPELVAIDSCGRTTDTKIEFLSQEREEMRRLTTATKISHNVYLGNSADAFNSVIECITADGKSATKGFDVCIETKDMAEIASAETLKQAGTFLNGEGNTDILLNRSGSWYARSLTRPLALEFPSSTPPLITRHDPQAIVNFCDWIYHITHPPTATQASEDVVMTDTQQEPPAGEHTVLIHCQDGYTESTFLALAYLIFSEGITAHEAWVRLHTTLQRSFFAFESDLQALKFLQSHLLDRSPNENALKGPVPTPQWFTHGTFDGSFPSRILPHMYLGNLQHANNPEMLRAIGITRVLSIGEEVVWDMDSETANGMHLMYLDNVQDNGIDPLLDYIDHCLEFLGIPSPCPPSHPPHC